MAPASDRKLSIEQLAFEVLQASHHADHLEGGPGCFNSAVMFLAEAAGASLFFILKEEDAMNDRLAGVNLQIGKRVAHGVGDILCMCGLTLEDSAETNDRLEDGVVRLGESCGNDWNFKGPWDLEDFNAGNARLRKFFLCRFYQRLGVGLIVPGSDDGDRCIDCLSPL